MALLSLLVARRHPLPLAESSAATLDSGIRVRRERISLWVSGARSAAFTQFSGVHGPVDQLIRASPPRAVVPRAIR